MLSFFSLKISKNKVKVSFCLKWDFVCLFPDIFLIHRLDPDWPKLTTYITLFFCSWMFSPMHNYQILQFHWLKITAIKKNIKNPFGSFRGFLVILASLGMPEEAWPYSSKVRIFVPVRHLRLPATKEKNLPYICL